jgi:hypothetical protein
MTIMRALVVIDRYGQVIRANRLAIEARAFESFEAMMRAGRIKSKSIRISPEGALWYRTRSCVNRCHTVIIWLGTTSGGCLCNFDFPAFFVGRQTPG